MIGTANLHGKDPKVYLTAVLKLINNAKASGVSSLLPWNIDLTDSQVTEAI
ncbi:MAG: transposase domain-containing protein [Oceanospirillaceae bacterium]|nr:transposase domain-containing protein [Oceanospirillaceae bacterium]